MSHVLRVRRTMLVMMPLDLIRRVMSRTCALNEYVSRTMLVSHVLRVRRTMLVMMRLDLIRRVMSRLCAENERVSNNACVACAAGTTNDAGDDASGSDTTCDVTTAL